MPIENKSGGILLGTVIGGAVGVVATLLLAPKSGAKMRKELSNAYHSFCDKTKEIATTVGSTTKDLVENVKEEASDLVEHAKESNQNIKDSLATTKDELKDKFSSSNI